VTHSTTKADHRGTCRFIAVLTACSAAGVASAAVTIYENDFAGWSAAAGPATNIGFTEYPQGTPITDQYELLGVTFGGYAQSGPFGEPFVLFGDGFLQDGVGLRGNPGIELIFSEPMRAVGVDFPGGIRFKAYLGDTLIFQSFTFGGMPLGNFGGFVSDTPFDRVILWMPQNGNVFIDTLYFATVPTPGAALPLVAALLGRLSHQRRRR
jgi:hypothetical protein